MFPKSHLEAATWSLKGRSATPIRGQVYVDGSIYVLTGLLLEPSFNEY